MTKLRFTALTSIAVVCASAGCKPPTPPAPPPPTVTVAHPIQREIVEWDEYTGRTEAAETVELRARVGGVLESVHFKDGALVEKGDLLFKIDARIYQATLERALAELERARAQRDIAARDYERVEKVGPNGAVAAEEIDQRLMKRQTAEAMLRSAEAAVTSARLDVEFTEIKAPIAGRIGRKLVSEGNIVNAGPMNGTILTTIVSVDPIYCYIDADENAVLKYIRLASQGLRASARDEAIPAKLAFADESEFRHEGVVDFVDNRVDAVTGTLRGRIVFPNPDGRLIPGLFARVRLPGSARYTATLTSDEAVGTDQAQRFVYVVDDKGLVRYRRVVLGSTWEGLRIVREGLGPADRVIVNGLMRVRPDVPVTVEEKPLALEMAGAASSANAATK